MNFNEIQLQTFLSRIDRLYYAKKPLFGTLDTVQMLCQCIQFFDMAVQEGSKDTSNPKICRGEPPRGTHGTSQLPDVFQMAKVRLKKRLWEFAHLPDDFEFAEHPYFGKVKREFWVQLAIYHLDHHLKLFDI